mmetsp:Transcript_5562/g.12108  ORF Transcript_5562/g.12108 Transcript_5562/m.12108 type:complete len:216 (-) Transcript_5562:478-1125(-)
MVRCNRHGLIIHHWGAYGTGGDGLCAGRHRERSDDRDCRRGCARPSLPRASARASLFALDVRDTRAPGRCRLHAHAPAAQRLPRADARLGDGGGAVGHRAAAACGGVDLPPRAAAVGAQEEVLLGDQRLCRSGQATGGRVRDQGGAGRAGRRRRETEHAQTGVNHGKHAGCRPHWTWSWCSEQQDWGRLQLASSQARLPTAHFVALLASGFKTSE